MTDLDQIPVPKRYLTPAMAGVWSEQSKYQVWAEVEKCAARALGAPPDAINAMISTPAPTPEQVASEEARTGHDVLAFLAAWRSSMDPAGHAWVHRGMTSSDLVDSALACTVNNSCQLISDAMYRMTRAVGKHAIEHQYSMMTGRTHGQVAEITTWGYRVADIATAMMRAHARFRTSAHMAVQAKLSGPVGDYKHVSREQELEFSRLLLGTGRTPITATQVVARDALADLVFSCALIASSVERLATEVRLASQSGINEVREGATSRRMGSSAMPHKKNPVTSENLVGLARLVRAQVGPMLEDVALWNERDISHSSVERVALPTALALTEFMVLRAANLVTELVVDRAQMVSSVYANEPEISSATARAWLISNGLTDPDLAWSLVKEAVSKVDTAHEVLPSVIARVARDWMKSGKITQNQFPDFAPVWTELIDACTITTGGSRNHRWAPRTGHVFDWLRKNLGEI